MWYKARPMKKAELLTKDSIARELSGGDEPLSIRSVERYIQLAGVEPAVKGSGRGKQAKFSRADVEKIKTAYKTAAERREQQSTAFRERMKTRNGIEGTHSELVRAHGLRRARYRGRSKVDLAHQFIGAACNIKRWLRLLAREIQEKAPESSPPSGGGGVELAFCG